MIPDDVVDQVREHADIVSIVGELVKLKRVGNSFRGPCPFHQGKDPNFSVSPRGGYMCFVCHEKGDVFSFVQKRLGLDFVDAVKYVGAKSGIEVKDVSRAAATGPDPRERFWELNAAAAEYFSRTLCDDEMGGPAREYLAKRNMDRETAQRFGLGFAPRDPALLRANLQSLGYDDARQIEAGLLVVKNEGEEPRPRFRNRLMFPIYDPQGRVIAFGGRVIDSGEPKYLNSAESVTFQKGSTLYGLNWAKNAIRKDARALLVEGYFDCVRLLAAGVESTVAPLGTALTEAQAGLLRKYTDAVFLLYDSDKAGSKATFRAGDVLLRQGFKVHVVTLPDGEDPDSFVSRHGREKLEAQLGNAIDVFERKLQILQRSGWFSDLRRKRVALDRLLPTIRAAADPITFGLYLARAAEVAGISEEALRRELREAEPAKQRAIVKGRPSQKDVAAPSKARTDEGYSAELWIVELLLKHKQLLERAGMAIELREFKDARLRAIFEWLLAGIGGDDIDALRNELPEHALELYRFLESKSPMPNAQLVLDKSVSKLKAREISEKLDDIQLELHLADDVDKNDILVRQGRLFHDLRTLGAQRWKAVRTSRQK
jgi:DNA primase